MRLIDGDELYQKVVGYNGGAVDKTVAKRLIDQMPTIDAVSRQAAIDGFYEMASDMEHLCTVGDYISFLKSLSAQPERKRGKWDTFFSDSYKVHEIGVECSCCGYRTQERTTYCPNCGAEMRKEEMSE